MLFRSGREATAELLATAQPPDVVVCSSDVLAQGALVEALSRGLRVPGDVAVMGFGDLSFAPDLHPALTTVHIDGAAIGRQAARFILDRIEERDIGARVRDIGFAIVPRASA